MIMASVKLIGCLTILYNVTYYPDLNHYDIKHCNSDLCIKFA